MGKGTRSRSNSHSMQLSSSPFESSNFLSHGGLRKAGRNSPFDFNRRYSGQTMPSYRMIVEDDVHDEWLALCRSITDVFPMDINKAQALLQYTNWNREKLLQEYPFDPEAVC